MVSVRRIRKTPSDLAHREVKIHLNVWLLPVLVAALGILYILTGFRGWLIFFIGTAGAWLVAFLWVDSLKRNLSIERKINLAWAIVGESVPEQVKLTNQGWLPAVWVEITDESSTLESPLRIVSAVSQHSYRSRHLTHMFKRRGVYTLGPTRLRCGDPFGIYTLSMEDQHASTILVTPPVLGLAELKIPTGGWTGDERHLRGYIARNISDAGLRNYVPGDSLKHIHWRASAHFDELIVRQHETANSRDWWIFVDLDTSVQAGIGEQSTLELSIVLAASLALRGLREHRKVGLVLAGPQFVWIEPGADPMQGWRILRALAMARAGQRALAEVLIQSRFSQVATAILITPSTNSAWIAAADRQRKDGSTFVLLVDPTDFGIPIDQGRVISALTQTHIPYVRMPGSLLEEAYSISSQDGRRHISGSVSGKRYFQQERQSWQSMD